MVLILQQKKKYDTTKILDDDIEGGREERAFRMWIYSLGLPDVYITNLYEGYKPGIVNWKIVDKKVKKNFGYC